ncbi:hypothetical protein F3Y22_tig00018191pilonHSYRG00033 [Hibiscus syriacus]|uniref:Uncharacterized protein n=1 Tax=Hibiscus syriacus TaxID=106335 RepID=A0A6A3BVV2_HIBSY|nr:hypothetical protein F3Y22_tig00018191pilonHSYRG00033 [Hibiscus syriacus]
MEMDELRFRDLVYDFSVIYPKFQCCDLQILVAITDYRCDLQILVAIYGLSCDLQILVAIYGLSLRFTDTRCDLRIIVAITDTRCDLRIRIAITDTRCDLTDTRCGLRIRVAIYGYALRYTDTHCDLPIPLRFTDTRCDLRIRVAIYVFALRFSYSRCDYGKSQCEFGLETLVKKRTFKCAMKGEWNTVKAYTRTIHRFHVAKIIRSGDTALHIAVSNAQEAVVEQLSGFWERKDVSMPRGEWTRCCLRFGTTTEKHQCSWPLYTARPLFFALTLTVKARKKGILIAEEKMVKMFFTVPYLEDYFALISWLATRLPSEAVAISVVSASLSIVETKGATEMDHQFVPPNYVTFIDFVKLLSKAILVILGLGRRKTKHTWAVQIMNELLQHVSMYQYEDNGCRPQQLLYDADETKPYEITEGGDVKMLASGDDSHPAKQRDKIKGKLQKEKRRKPKKRRKERRQYDRAFSERWIVTEIVHCTLPQCLGDHRPWLIPGAALQMQWEIKWYECSIDRDRGIRHINHRAWRCEFGEWNTHIGKPSGIRCVRNLIPHHALFLGDVRSDVLSILTSRYQERDFGIDLHGNFCWG